MGIMLHGRRWTWALKTAEALTVSRANTSVLTRASMGERVISIATAWGSWYLAQDTSLVREDSWASTIQRFFVSLVHTQDLHIVNFVSVWALILIGCERSWSRIQNPELRESGYPPHNRHNRCNLPASPFSFTQLHGAVQGIFDISDFPSASQDFTAQRRASTPGRFDTYKKLIKPERQLMLNVSLVSLSSIRVEIHTSPFKLLVNIKRFKCIPNIIPCLYRSFA